MDIKNIMKKYPNVLRQSMLEMKGKNLDVAKFVMCKKELQKILETLECGKRSGDINSPMGKTMKYSKLIFLMVEKKDKRLM